MSFQQFNSLVVWVQTAQIVASVDKVQTGDELLSELEACQTNDSGNCEKYRVLPDQQHLATGSGDQSL